jgi:glycosyltransferase involved in cell wall biosynthesis
MPKGQMIFYRNVGRLRANSSAVEAAIHNEFKGSKSLTKVIPNPLTFLRVSRFSFDEKDRIILYVGRIHREKGIEILIEGFKKAILYGLKGYKLKIIGPYETYQGGGGEEYMKTISSKINNENIEFKEPIFDTDRLNNEYRKASIFIYPSIAEKGETFGISPLEAMAWGCIPIVSNLDCFKDFITHESNGFIFDHRSKAPSEELARIINHIDGLNQETSTRIRETCSLVTKTHSVENIANQFLQDFEYLKSNEKKN